MGLSIQERRRGQIAVLELDGELGEQDCPVLSKAIRRVFGEKCFDIILQLEKVSYIGSHALGILLFADKEARESGGAVKLLKVPPMIRMVLQGTRTKFLLEAFHHEETALASFGKVVSVKLT